MLMALAGENLDGDLDGPVRVSESRPKRCFKGSFGGSMILGNWGARQW
jgi:hypothetical protein